MPIYFFIAFYFLLHLEMQSYIGREQNPKPMFKAKANVIGKKWSGPVGLGYPFKGLKYEAEFGIQNFESQNIGGMILKSLKN